MLFTYYRALADLDGTGSSRESWQTGLEGGDLAPGSTATSVDACHAELVRCPWLQLHLFRQTLVALDVDLGLLEVAVGKVVAGHRAGGALDDPNIEPVGLPFSLLRTHFVKLVFHQRSRRDRERGGGKFLILLLDWQAWQGWGGGLLRG